MRFKIFVIAAGLAAASTPALAQDDTTCETKGANGMVAVVLCPPGLDQDAWKAAGEAACGQRRPCGAWIWDDTKNVPVLVPDSHDKLPQNAVRSAKAIWVSEQQSLMVIEKESN
ncbi:MAG: hypothetical protein AB3N13_08145 [Arenibacterium sp.]